MSSEPEMSQRPNRGCTLLSIFYRRSLLVQGLGWIGGLGVLSSGLVGAKADQPPDVVVPTLEEAPQPVTMKAEPTPDVAPKPSAPEVSTISMPERNPQATVVRQRSVRKRNARATVVRQRSARRQNPQATVVHKPSAPERESEPSVVRRPSAPERESEPSVVRRPSAPERDLEPVVVRRPSAPERESEPSVVRKLSLPQRATAPDVVDKPSTSELATATAVPNKAALSAPDLFVPTIEEGTPPGVVPSQTSAKLTVENEVYIDSSNDSIGVTGSGEDAKRIITFDKPAPVALTEQSTDCKTVLKGPGLYRGVCGAVKLTQATAYTGRDLRVPNLSKVRMRQRQVAAVRPVNIGPIRVSSRGLGVRSRRSHTTPIAQKSTSPTTLAYYNPTIPLPGLASNGNTSKIFPLTIPAQITSVFGWRMHPILGYRRFHPGTDIGAPMGTPVLATAAGQVQSADWMGSYGKAIVLQHSQTEQTLYGHLSEIFVQPGQVVEQGTLIGRVGSTGRSTGPHLHFETRQLTNQGWVATDAGAQLKYGVAQLLDALRTAQTTPQPGS